MKVIKSEKLSTQFEPRFICVDENSGEILDDAQGYGFTSAKKAAACYFYKNKSAEQISEEKRKNKIISEFLSFENRFKKINDALFDIWFYGSKDGLSDAEIDKEANGYLDAIGFDFKTNGISKKY